jgi:hypothetical protein
MRSVVNRNVVMRRIPVQPFLLRKLLLSDYPEERGRILLRNVGKVMANRGVTHKPERLGSTPAEL